MSGVSKQFSDRIKNVLDFILLKNQPAELLDFTSKWATEILGVNTTAEYKENTIYLYPVNNRIAMRISKDVFYQQLFDFSLNELAEKKPELESSPEDDLFDVVISCIEDILKSVIQVPIDMIDRITIDSYLSESEFKIFTDKVLENLASIPDIDFYVGDTYINTGSSYNDFICNVKAAFGSDWAK